MSASIEVMRNLTFDESAQSFWVENSSAQELIFSSPVLSKEELETRAHIIWEHTKQHPGAMTLLQQSLHNGSISVVFRTEAEIQTDAYWDHRVREIGILSTETRVYDLLTSFVFELNNSTNENLPIPKIVSQDAEDFAIKTEIEEYKAHQNTFKIMSDGVKKYGWPQSKTPIAFCTLEQFLTGARLTRAAHTGISHFNIYKVEFYNQIIEGLDAAISREIHLRSYCEKILRMDAVNNHSETNEDIPELRILWKSTNAEIEKYQIARAVSVYEKEKIENEASNWLIQKGQCKSFLPSFLNCTKTTWTLAAITCVGVLGSMYTKQK